jgi:hypothetical protein
VASKVKVVCSLFASVWLSLFSAFFSPSSAEAQGALAQFGLEEASLKVSSSLGGKAPGAGVRIAALSSGLAFSIPALARTVPINAGESGDGKECDAIDNEGNGFVDDSRGWDAFGAFSLPKDSYLGFGTFAASIWVANPPKGEPRVLGFVPGAQILPVRVLDDNGFTNVALMAEGLHYAKVAGAQIVHIDASLRTADARPLCDALEELNQAGILVIAPAGNTGGQLSDRDFPASCGAENLVVVAASDGGGQLARFSSYDAVRVHVAAPGVALSGLDSQGRMVTRSGTNGASALVVALSVLLRNQFPFDSPLQLKQRLIRGKDDNPSFYGKVAADGRLNALKALESTP